MTKRLFAFFAVFVFAVTMTVSAADARISMGADVRTTIQDVESERGGTSNDEKFGFGEPQGNLHLFGDVSSNVDAYVEVYLNPYGTEGFGDCCHPDKKTELAVGELHLTADLGAVDLKFGEFEVPFGNQRLRRSDQGQVQDNPFVENGLVDPNARQLGLEIAGSPGPMDWSVAVTNGEGMNVSQFSNSEFTSPGSGLGYMASFGGEFGPGIATALSWYQADHSRTGGEVESQLFSNPQFSAVQGIAPNSNFGSFDFHSPALQKRAFLSGDPGDPDFTDNGENALGDGQDVSAYQLDFGWHGQMVTVDAFYGNVEDEAVSTEADYYGLDTQVNFTPDVYGAARYHVVEPDEIGGATVTGEPEQISLGFGYHLNENTLAKVEYIDLENGGLGGTDVEADGLIAELSASF